MAIELKPSIWHIAENIICATEERVISIVEYTAGCGSFNPEQWTSMSGQVAQ